MIRWTLGLALLTAIALFFGCGTTTPQPVLAQDGALELLFTYGSEKKAWIEAVTAAFNASNARTADNKPIRVRAVAKGSGECVEDLLRAEADTAVEERAHLTSPASAAYVDLGNARWKRDKTLNPNGAALLDAEKARTLVLSPVVIAMWEPMAQSLGWPNQPLGWAEVIKLANDPKGWAGKGHAEWGRFKFGHTHPEYSNSGLLSVLAECYAGAGKTRDLTVADMKKPEVSKFLRQIEQSVVHYGSSTGFFTDKMTANGPAFLSAAVVYENLVVEHNLKLKDAKIRDTLATDMRMVAIYPREGTFWSDHPAVMVNRPWVTDAHRQAAKLYIDFLMTRDNQTAAMKYGFRPADETIALAAPLVKENGIDPKQPTTVLPVPEADVTEEMLKLFREQKKPLQVYLVLDTSGSMSQMQKMIQAKRGIEELITMFGPRDSVAFMTFNSQVSWVQQKPIAMNDAGKESLQKIVAGIFPQGETALYDATAAAHAEAVKSANADTITAVVVLTDGEDNKSKLTLESKGGAKGLLDLVKFDPEGAGIRIYTIAYGADASGDVLKKIAERSQARSREGTPKNIRQIFREIFLDF